MAGEQRGDQARFWREPLDRNRVTAPVGLIHIIAERCKGCAFCVEFCPLDVLQLSTRFNCKGYHPPEIVDDIRCAACHLCEVVCPEFAIFVDEHVGNAYGKAVAGPAGAASTREEVDHAS